MSIGIVNPHDYLDEDKRPAWSAMSDAFGAVDLPVSIRPHLLNLEADIDREVRGSKTAAYVEWDGRRLTLYHEGVIPLWSEAP